VASEFLQFIGEQLKQAEKMLAETEELIRTLEEAGEDTTAQRREFVTLKARLQRWKEALRRRGVKVD